MPKHQFLNQNGHFPMFRKNRFSVRFDFSYFHILYGKGGGSAEGRADDKRKRLLQLTDLVD